MRPTILFLLFAGLAVSAIAGGALGSKKKQELATLIEQAKAASEKRDSAAYDLIARADALVSQSSDSLEWLRTVLTRAEIANAFEDSEQAFTHLDRVRKYLSMKLESGYEADMHLQYARAYQAQGLYGEAEQRYDEAMDAAQVIADSVRLRKIRRSLSANYRFVGQYDKAYEMKHALRREYLAEGDSAEYMEVNVEIGIVDFLRREPDKALAQWEAAQQWFMAESDSFNVGLTYSLICLVYFSKRDYETALEKGEKSLEYRLPMGIKSEIGESYNNLGLCYAGMKKSQKALEYFEKAFEYKTRANDLRELPTILANIGDMCRALDQPERALNYYLQALEIAERGGSQSQQANVCQDLAEAFAAQGDYEQAYTYHKRYASLNDSVFSQRRARAIQEVEIRQETDDMQHQIELLERDGLRKRDLNFGLGIGIGLLAVISILLLLLQRAKVRNARTALLHHERQLEAHTRNLLEKSSLIEELEQRLLETPAVAVAAPEDPQRVANISALQEMKILTEKDWEAYKALFDKVHAGFLLRLRDQHPDLTIAEQRMFMLLKLKLNTREIANMLGILPETVRKSRYRLRKKLQLDQDTDLQAFVSKF